MSDIVPGTLTWSTLKGGSAVFNVQRTRFLGVVKHKEPVFVIANTGVGWLLIYARCGVGWARIKGFPKDLDPVNVKRV